MKRICERAAGGHCSTTMTKLEVFDAWRDFRSRWDRAHQDYTPRISCEHLVTQREVVRPSAMLSAIDPGGGSQTIGSGQKPEYSKHNLRLPDGPHDARQGR